jgi:hypothetical protein
MGNKRILKVAKKEENTKRSSRNVGNVASQEAWKLVASSKAASLKIHIIPMMTFRSTLIFKD